MRIGIIITLVALLLMIDLTVQKPKIGRLCPDSEILEKEFGNMCVRIKCRYRKLLNPKFKIEPGLELNDLHPRFHKVTRCKSKCPSGYLSKPTNMSVFNLKYPKCCAQRICVNTAAAFNSLETVE